MATHSLPCSCLGNSVDRGAWQAIVHGVSKSSDQQLTHSVSCVQGRPAGVAREQFRPYVSAEEVEDHKSKSSEKSIALVGSQGFEIPHNTRSLIYCAEMSHSGLRD